MKVQVPATRYSTVDIHEHVTGTIVGAGRNISLSSLFTHVFNSLQPQFKTGHLNSRFFAEYVGNLSRIIQIKHPVSLSWESGQICDLWEICPYDMSIGIQFNLLIANWDCSIKRWPNWITVWDESGQWVVPNQLINRNTQITVVPNSEIGIPRDGSIAIGNNIGSIFQVPTNDLILPVHQNIIPTGLTITEDLNQTVSGGWPIAPGATEYQYRVNVNSVGFSNPISTGTSTSFITSIIFGSFTPGDIICVQYRIIVGQLISNWSHQNCLTIQDPGGGGGGGTEI